MSVCRLCGGDLIGDGYTTPVHCEFAELEGDEEPDSGPIYCEKGDNT